jgi:hypothetical protein
MKRWSGRLLVIAGVCVLLLAAWLWWNRPQPVDMSVDAPADALIYLEANSLPDILDGLAATDAWRTLAPPAGLKTNLNQMGWLSRAAAWTGIGSAESVLLARAQVALVVMGFDAAEESEQALHIKPRAALIVETHMSQRRAQTALEKLIGDYARHANGTTQVERRTAGDAGLIVWPNQRGGLPIVAAITDGVAFIGNDEATVQACLATRRGQHPALTSDPQLAEMRERMRADTALAFGYVPPAGARRLLEVAAIAYVGRFAEDQKAQSAAAILLPQIANHLLGGAAWSARVEDGAMTDTYFLAVPSDVPPRLRAALTPADEPAPGAAALLPADVYQLTRYNFREPDAAWRELQAALSSQLEITIAPFVARFLDEALKPLGIADPREFLRAAGPELATVRLDDTGERLLLVAQVRDPEALRAQVKKQLGSVRIEHVGDAELWLSTDEERGAACFVGDYLLLGDAGGLRRGLAARAAGQTLATSEGYTHANNLRAKANPAGITTYSDEREATRSFITLLARQRALRTGGAQDEVALQRAVDAQAFAVSETRPVEGGFEKRTRSAFGQFGTLAGQFYAR